MLTKYSILGFFLIVFQTNIFAETIDILITDKTQDTEERVSNGKMDNNDAALDIVYEKNNQQLVGLRFENIAIPKGSTINSAYIEFVAKGKDSRNASFIIKAESSDNAETLTKTAYDISGRTTTTSSYNWDNVPAWKKNEIYKTGNLSALVQEITDRNGWEYGNAILFMIEAGSECTDSGCRRRAKSSDNSADEAALLHIDFTPPPLSASLIADYKLDECYWLGGANGVNGDIVDSSSNKFDATSVDRIDSEEVDYKICRSGSFGDNSYAVVDNSFTLGNQWSMSLWIKFPFVKEGKRYYILGSYPDDGDLPVFQYNNDTLKWGIYDNSKQLQWNDIDNSLSGWHHLIFVNAGAKTTLYLDGNKVNSIDLGTSGNVAYLWSSSDDLSGQSIASNIDEMKFFSRIMTPNEIKTVYQNEDNGNNYNGTPRNCPSCDSTTISAKSWELVGIPADNNGKSVEEVFTMSGTYGSDWRVYRRDYSDTNNSSWNTYLAKTDLTEFGKGYWLGSAKDDRWDVSSLPEVTYVSHSDCVASKCVEIDLVPVSLDSNATPPDDLKGTGPYRNHLSGFVGLKKPVNWKDCRFIIDGQAYTPQEAEENNFASRQVWLYNPNGSGANNNGYTTCADNSPGGCKLIPFKGFSVELRGPTKNKTVKLLIPQE